MKVAEIIKKAVQGFGSALSSISHFISRQIEKENEAHIRSQKEAEAQRVAIQRQAEYEQSCIHYEAISVELSEILKVCASQLDVIAPINPVDIYEYTGQSIPPTPDGAYYYRINRTAASNAALRNKNIYRCSAMQAGKILQNEINRRFATCQAAVAFHLFVQISESVDRLSFKILVRIGN